MLRHVEVEDSAALMGQYHEDKEDAQARGGHGEEIDGDQVPDVLARNVRQVWDGGMRRVGISRETVRSATSMPSFSSSPWILGAPHKGFIAAILLTRATISALIGGRPT
jgi:hypothetical protein